MAKKPNREEPARHRWLDQWLAGTGLGLRQLENEIVASLENYEQTVEPRTRKRRASDQQRYGSAVNTIIANLAQATLMPPETGRLAISTRNAEGRGTRYQNRAFGKAVRDILRHLHELGVVDRRRSFERGEVSSIAPSGSFQDRVRQLGISLSEFARVEHEEVILLTLKTEWRNGHERMTRRDRINYADTTETRAMRQAVRELNEFLAEANITFDDPTEPRINPYDRTMRRHFVLRKSDKRERFDRSGRLFGGFWQNLKSDRRQHIRIEGEPVAVLDFSSMFPRLAFATVNAQPPASDLYAIPGLEHCRPAVKVAFNCLLFDDFWRRRWPTDLVRKHEHTGDEEVLPEGWTVRRLKTAILERHPALKPCFGRGVGDWLMHTESQVLMGVLDELRSRRIVALGLHDAVMVAKSKRDEVRVVMQEVARAVTSAELPVEVKA